MGREVTGVRMADKPDGVVKSNGILLKTTGAGNTQARLSPSKAGANGTANADYTPPPTKYSETNSPKTPLMTRKHHDDDDNWSVASSTTASVRTARSRVTIGTAPTFRSAERVMKRKEFYQKLEEKHQALEAQRQQYEALKKEEEEADLKQLRKNLFVKANPVPSFYYEGPPPEVELKKLPLTRPKSPNLTRRKSCGNVIHLAEEEKPEGCCQGHGHSFSHHRERTDSVNEPKCKGQKNGMGCNGGSRLNDRVKKLPLTRPKSPNLTRRKSCGDVIDLAEEEKPKGCCQGHGHGHGHGHSFSHHRERTDFANESKCKGQKNGVGCNGGSRLNDRVKKVKDATKSSPMKLAEQSNANITVQS